MPCGSGGCRATTALLVYKDGFANGARVCEAIGNNGHWNNDCNLGPDLITAYMSGIVLSADAKLQVTVVLDSTWHTEKNLNESKCRTRCADKSVCWGFVYQTTSTGDKRCLYLGGCAPVVAGGPTPSVFNIYTA